MQYLFPSFTYGVSPSSKGSRAKGGHNSMKSLPPFERLVSKS